MGGSQAVLSQDDGLRREYGQVWGKPYGRGWPAIRAAALKRAGGACEIGCAVYRGPCTDRPSARLHVHHVALGDYGRLWPVLTYEDTQLLVLHAYRLAWQKRQAELEGYLRANPELFPVVCAHHHSLFGAGFNGTEMLRVLQDRNGDSDRRSPTSVCHHMIREVERWGF